MQDLLQFQNHFLKYLAQTTYNRQNLEDTTIDVTLWTILGVICIYLLVVTIISIWALCYYLQKKVRSWDAKKIISIIAQSTINVIGLFLSLVVIAVPSLFHGSEKLDLSVCFMITFLIAYVFYRLLDYQKGYWEQISVAPKSFSHRRTFNAISLKNKSRFWAIFNAMVLINLALALPILSENLSFASWRNQGSF